MTQAGVPPGSPPGSGLPGGGLPGGGHPGGSGARQLLKRMRGIMAQTGNAESRLRQAQAGARKKEHGYRPEEIAAARAELAQAEADRKKMEVRLAEHKIVSPADAVIEIMDARPGDLVGENDPVATLLERGQLYVRVYVPETKLGLARPGQPAEVTVDSFRGQKFAAHVEQVNQKAEYLPRNVETEDARSHQFFGLKLAIDDPGSGLRAGMAADVTLQVGGN